MWKNKKQGSRYSRDPTLEYIIAEHARLTIFNIFSTLLTLNRSCLLNYFEDFIHPAHLLGTAHFIFQGNLEF